MGFLARLFGLESPRSKTVRKRSRSDEESKYTRAENEPNPENSGASAEYSLGAYLDPASAPSDLIMPDGDDQTNDDAYEAPNEADIAEVAEKAEGSTGIWDISPDAEPEPEPEPEKPVEAAPKRASGRLRRNRTRLIGFDKSDGTTTDVSGKILESVEEVEPAPRVVFPVGFLLVVNGPGRGECFPLVNGLSSIGRGVDNIVALNFGDDAISRSGHAAIIWEDKDRAFTLGHGNKANIVRLNDKPVIANEKLKEGDLIHLGETTLRLVVLCDSSFDWANFEEDDGHEDVAIA